MANDIKGIIVRIGADTTDLSKAMSSANRSISTTQKQLNEVQKALKLDPSNTDLLAQKYRLLTEKADETRKKLQTLKDAQEQVEEQYRNGEIDQGKYDAFRRELISTENQLKKLEKEAAKSNYAPFRRCCGNRHCGGCIGCGFRGCHGKGQHHCRHYGSSP